MAWYGYKFKEKDISLSTLFKLMSMRMFLSGKFGHSCFDQIA